MPHSLDDLMAAATDAHTAAHLELIQAEALERSEERAQLSDRMATHLAEILGPEYAELADVTLEPDADGYLWATAKMGELVVRTSKGTPLYGLVTCPRCNAWNVSTARPISDLADAGEILVGKAELRWHDHADDKSTRCNGLRMEPQPIERPAWRVANALNPKDLAEVLNDFAEAGYAATPMHSDRGGTLIVGKRVGDRFNQHYDTGDQPF